MLTKIDIIRRNEKKWGRDIIKIQYNNSYYQPYVCFVMRSYDIICLQTSINLRVLCGMCGS